MIVRPVRWSDFPTFVEFYYTRYDEVTRNPDLFLYTQAKKPALGEEAIWFGSLMREILDGDTVCMVAEEDGRVVGAADVTDYLVAMFKSADALAPGHATVGPEAS